MIVLIKFNEPIRNNFTQAHSRKAGQKKRTIYPRKTILPKILSKLNKQHPEKFNVKRFDTDFTRCDIIDGKKVMIKLVQQDPLQFGGIFFIENENLATNLKKIFNEMWEQGG